MNVIKHHRRHKELKMTGLSILLSSLMVLLTCSAMMVPATATATVVDRVVAVVNDQVITLSELKAVAAPYLAQIKARNGGAQLDSQQENQLLAQVLPQLIDQRLVEEEVKRLHLEASDETVDAALERISAQNGMTRKMLAAELARQGLDMNKYRREIKNQIERSRIIQSQVKGKIAITDEQIDNYLKEHPVGQSSGKGPIYALEHICVTPSDMQDPEARRRASSKAAEALKAIEGGMSFEEAAARFSDVPSAQDGGMLGSFTLEEMAPFMKNAIMGLKAGEHTKVVETPVGYQIFKVKEIVEQGKGSTSAALREEIRQKLYKNEIDQRFEEWLRKLRSKSTIRILL